MINNSFTRAEINLGNLADNYKKMVGFSGGTPVISVIKADAYGHGAVESALTLKECGCRMFAVATVSEALDLRKAVPDCDILILGAVPCECADILSDNNIITALPSLEYAEGFSKNLSPGKQLRVHIKIDTGMNRIGFSPDDRGLAEALRARDINGISVEGIFTHLATADEPEQTLQFEQLEKFRKSVQYLCDCGTSFKIRHISNSAATVLYPDMRFDAVRCGIVLYGYPPSDDVAVDLKPVMTLKTSITHIHEINNGDSVGYGASFKAKRRMRIATMPIGYDDGFIRAYAKYGAVLLNGERCPVVGRICMDQTMIDVTDAGASLWDEVEIFGENNPIDLFVRSAGTISYEVLCLIGKRVPRIYLK